MCWTIMNIVTNWLKNVGENHVGTSCPPLLLWPVLWLGIMWWRDLKVVLLIQGLLQLWMEVKMVISFRHLTIIIFIFLFLIILRVGQYTRWGQLLWGKPIMGIT